MKIIIAGGSGLIGKKIAEVLIEQGNSVVLLSRNPENIHIVSNLLAKSDRIGRLEVHKWSAAKLDNLIPIIETSDAVINLSGESIASKRWTVDRKQKILSSRIDSTRALVDAIGQARNKPSVFLNASAVGFYGNVPNGDVTEKYPEGAGFLSDVCGRWEREALKANSYGVRVVLLRTGIVLDKSEGALKKLLVPFNLFVGGPLGNGKQWFPWIHLKDEVDAIVFALKNKELFGPVNLTAPQTVSMNDFCKVLGKVLHRPSWLSVPSPVLKILLGEMAGPLLLQGQKVIPQKLLDSGFKFNFPELERSLEDILLQ